MRRYRSHAASVKRLASVALAVAPLHPLWLLVD
jgi:hypothetical protein